VPTRFNFARKLECSFFKSLVKNGLSRASPARELSLPIREAIEAAKSVSNSAEFLGGIQNAADLRDKAGNRRISLTGNRTSGFRQRIKAKGALIHQRINRVFIFPTVRKSSYSGCYLLGGPHRKGAFALDPTPEIPSLETERFSL